MTKGKASYTRRKNRIQKIFLGGGIGSGKSTLAKKLSLKFNLPLLEIDSLVYKDNYGNKFTEKESKHRLENFLLKNKSWIIEGTQKRSWCNKAIKSADIIIILNIHWLICLRRFIKRKIKRFLVSNHQKINNLKKIKYIKRFRQDDLKEYKYMMKRNNTKSIFLNNRKQINNFLNKITPLIKTIRTSHLRD